jgi:ferric-dicitrate binding protein FerR (iron transport regulator)
MKLVIETSSIASLRIGGNFAALDTGSFVAALEQSFGIIARTGRSGIYLFAPTMP